jgi:chromosome segregation ATPase
MFMFVVFYRNVDNLLESPDPSLEATTLLLRHGQTLQNIGADLIKMHTFCANLNTLTSLRSELAAVKSAAAEAKAEAEGLSMKLGQELAAAATNKRELSNEVSATKKQLEELQVRLAETASALESKEAELAAALRANEKQQQQLLTLEQTTMVKDKELKEKNDALRLLSTQNVHLQEEMELLESCYEAKGAELFRFGGECYQRVESANRCRALTVS